MDFDNEVQEQNQQKKSKSKIVLEWVEAIGIALVLTFLLRGFVFEQALVDGHSMQETLQDKQRLIVYKLGYHFNEPKRGDIVIVEYQKGKYKYLPFPDPTEVDYIKRVIGLPGDEIDLKDGSVYVNGNKLNEPYAKGETYNTGSMTYPVTVPEGSVFVLGDNRENSSDSRVIGFIEFDRVRGKAAFRLMPFSEIGSLYNNMEGSNIRNIGGK